MPEATLTILPSFTATSNLASILFLASITRPPLIKRSIDTLGILIKQFHQAGLQAGKTAEIKTESIVKFAEYLDEKELFDIADKVDDVLLSTNSFSFNSDASIFIVSRQFINTAFNVIASYGINGSNYASWYNESADRNFVDYNGATSKSKSFTGQGVLLTLNSYHTLSNVFTQYKNNVSQGSSSSATVPNITASPINLGKLVGVSSYGNINLSTFVALPSNSDSTQITAMYNLIRSLNNNAF
jgi:hypothetical protein